MMYADQRWIGNHGIGRFARHVLSGLEYEPVPLTSKPAAALDTWVLANALKSLGPSDLFFSPGYNTPLFCSAPFVFTIHDLTHIQCPESSSPQARLYYATVMKRACRRATRILTVSEFTRNRVIDWSGISPEKVTSVGNGVESSFRPEGDLYGLPFPYFLAVSNRKPHKNEFRTVEAFANADLDSGIHLVFTGHATVKFARWIETQGVSARVKFVGEVADVRLASLYRGAKALIFPSLYEGFGLPIIEAMACGTPVVTSNAAAMPETAGDAALLVDPRSTQQIAKAMEQIVGETSLCENLRSRGLRQAVRFSWTNTTTRVKEEIAASVASGTKEP